MLIQVVFSCNNIICNLNDNMFDTIDSEKRFTISEHFFFCSFAFASAVRSQKLATFITIFPRHRWIWHDTLSLDTKLTVVKQVAQLYSMCCKRSLFRRCSWLVWCVCCFWFLSVPLSYTYLAVAPYKSIQYEQVICTKKINIMKKRPKNGTHNIFFPFFSRHIYPVDINNLEATFRQ